MAVLSACASTRLVNFGFQLVESVSCEFGLVAKMEHYGEVILFCENAQQTWFQSLLGEVILFVFYFHFSESFYLP